MFNKMGSQSAAWSIQNKRDYDMAGTYTLGFSGTGLTAVVFQTFAKTPKLLSSSAAFAQSNIHAKTSRHLKAREDRKLAAAHKASQIPSMSGSRSVDLDDNPGSDSIDAFSDPAFDAEGEDHSNPHHHCPHQQPIHSMTDLSADPMVEFMSDAPERVANESNPQNEPPEFSRLGWTDSTWTLLGGVCIFPQAMRVQIMILSLNHLPVPFGVLPPKTLLRRRHIYKIYGKKIHYSAKASLLEVINYYYLRFFEDEDESDITAAELNNNLFGPDAKSEWFPYPDKAAFLTDVLFSSPRLRFSRAQQKAVLSWAKDLGASVPSYHKFRQTQDILLAEVGDPTKRQESGRGNVWYLNEIGDSIKKDMSNPFTRSGMTLYPEDAGNKSEKFGTETKCFVTFQIIFYHQRSDIMRSDSSWFLPKRWMTRSGGKVMLASGFNVTESPDGSLLVQDESLDIVEVSSFEFNFPQILDRTSGIYPLAAASDKFAKDMPHPLREKAGSRMVYSIPLAIFIDDVSGNKSKQWNKHFSCYMSNGALPRTKLENEFHVRFVGTPPFASPLEIMQGVRGSIEEAFAEPVVAWDCEAKEEVLLRPHGLLFAGDNPMQAELCSCAGLNTNFFCRTCQAGGTREWKQSNDGFAEVLKAGDARNPADTAEETFQQILTALEPNVATTLTEAVRLSGVKDALAQPIIDILVKMGQDLRKANPEGSALSPDEIQTILTEELKKHQQQGEGITNPLFDMDGNAIDHLYTGIDMHKDTPTEILHTILLGVVKYYWGQTVWLLEKGKDFALFQTRLNSILADGLNIPKIQADYMCQYKGGLIGKHFKTLSQIMAFAVEGLVPADVLEAWLILGRLTVLLWHTEIEDLKSYIAELEVCINDFINITCKCSPSILISKPKFHFLLHLPFFIRRFGPAVLFSTERYEAYNAVFRACSIYSNRLTPSRDIAWSFAGIDRVKHIVTGGWWRDSRSRKWTCANPRVLRHILDHPEMAAMVGLPTKVAHEPGRILTYPKRKPGEPTPECKLGWAESLAGLCKSNRFPSSTFETHRTASGLIASSGDKGEYSPLSFGTIREILLPVISSEIVPDSTTARVTVQLFKTEPALHSRLRMPIVIRTKESVVVLPEDIECAVNLQHDCHFGKCAPHNSVSVSILQEREATKTTRARIRHSDDDHFIVNTASLHNYHQISSAIPSSIAVHSFTVEDQAALRASAAAQIRDKGAGNADDPMSLTSRAAESEMIPREVIDNVVGPDDDELQADTEVELRPVTEIPAALDAPAFSRVGAGARARNQQAKQVPTTL
ncbi:hypothetical protein FB451DRAFT_1461207 [Mycena latifolia]|nr:hypothetical protein FB451DRAFT_1461207 [Mycena latifolia]